ncbi:MULTISPECIES: polysaccharide deacetylase family protein [unclassified Streptomyces]|uniref:polysaccharide deacetylase family protein n=1 Tax=unclassified Streptomyces TaxID=2593676 RepID=UPI000DC79CD2|nr:MULTISPECIES: polysaccharide deacetylase family protein [unclassified Streptomyces]AWZ04858.1 polysaccharide deacetylase family protein [Streptomyces sp. ICC4]AWZ12033.1 polysaccharide deacetylase family protein [Streptomyces sp. ICC1]
MWRSRALLAALASLSLALGVVGTAGAVGSGEPAPAAGAAVAAAPRKAGLPPVVSHVPTDEKVVFITIDDGWVHDPAVAQTLLDRRIPVSLFLLPGATSYDTQYFTNLAGQGRVSVENHTVNHPDLTALDAAGKDAEVCGAGEQLAATFGKEPKLLRPPFGAVNDDVRLAAKACGVKALITWTHDFTTWGETPATPQLRAGDIVLLHFTPTLGADLQRALDAAKAAGLKPAALMPHLKSAGLVP